jgi:hypothetical protein
VSAAPDIESDFSAAICPGEDPGLRQSISRKNERPTLYCSISRQTENSRGLECSLGGGAEQTISVRFAVPKWCQPVSLS